MSTVLRTSPELLNQAAQFRLMALAFAFPEPDVRRTLEAALAGLESAAAGGNPHRAVSSTRALLTHDDAAREYTRLFAGATPVPLRETAYGEGGRYAGREHALADLGGFYRAFGFGLAPDAAELGDALGAELEFYGLLLVKEAYAAVHGDAEGGDITSRAAAAFLDSHLGRWPNAMAQRLRAVDSGTVYLPVAEAACELVAGECERRGVVPAPAPALLTGDPVQADEFGCPYAAECCAANVAPPGRFASARAADQPGTGLASQAPGNE